jgi:hypothetical protein
MHVTSRSYLTAGIAALGVGAIALSPIQPIPNNVALAPERVVSNLAVDLAGIIDPWVATFDTAVQNAARLNAAWNASTFPIFQTFVTNQLIYVKELPNIGLIFNQIIDNWKSALQAPFVENPNNISTTITTVATIGGVPQLPLSQRDLYDLLQSPLSPLPPEIAPLLDFMTTPFSGAALAVIGPVIGPVLSFANDVKTIFAQLQARNLPAAIDTFLAIAPNAVNAFLNGGQILDLTGIVDRIAGPLPTSVESIGLNMGGLISSGLTPVDGADQGPISGTMFDGLAATASIDVGPVTARADDPGLSVGPIGATQLLSRKIADAIRVTPPLTAATVAPAAAEAEAEAEVEVAAPKAVEAAKAESEAPAAEAPATKRQTRATARADKDAGKSARSERGARRAG